jgi:hypothetical protein
VLAWLCQETERLPEAREQASEWFSRRSPEPEQIKLAEAVQLGFLLDYREWDLWGFIGRRTRQGIDERRLEEWRKELCKRFPAIADFQKTLRTFFWKSVGSGNVYQAHQEFDSTRHRAYLDRELGRLLDCASVVVANALEQMLPDAVLARFQDWLLCKGNKPKSQPTSEKLERKLAAAFPGSRFQLSVEEVTQ